MRLRGAHLEIPWKTLTEQKQQQQQQKHPLEFYANVDICMFKGPIYICMYACI